MPRLNVPLEEVKGEGIPLPEVTMSPTDTDRKEAKLVGASPLSRDGILAVLKQVHPNTKIDKDAIMYVSQLLVYIANKLAATPGATLNTRLRAVLSENLAKHAISEASKVYNRYLSLKPTKRKMANWLAYEGAFEYLLAEILELAGNATRDNGKVTITRRYIDLALVNDTDLAEVFEDVIPLKAVITPIKVKAGLKQAKARGHLVKRTQITRDLKAVFPGRCFVAARVVPIFYNIVIHLQTLFGTVNDQKYEAWLDSLPVKDVAKNLNERCYREVMGLLVGGILAQPEAPITYQVVVNAVANNPYYDLAAYLRTNILG